MNDITEIIKETYKAVVVEYNNIFIGNSYLPTKKAKQPSLVINGFTERNLTFNFCHTYLKQHPNAIVWQEIPIDKVKNQHIDSIIIDKDEDLVIYLEAKRLYDISSFEDLLEDFSRIEYRYSKIPIPPTQKPLKNKAVVLLADHYYSGEIKNKKLKEDYYDVFFNGKKINVMDELSNKGRNLLEAIDSSKNRICKDTDIHSSILIPKGNNYNIDIEKDIVYTIYCGVYFLDCSENK